ncbi:MAG: glycosyltransferase family 2 protein [Bacteroidota bacterium]|nr:glycosyltransferase family 2 protein [Bacteroidota bacterium]
MNTENISVDILISTFNWPQALESIFLSILGQTRLPDRILIADDGSGYETQMLIDKYRRFFNCPVEHIWQEDKGFRKTIILNKAMKYAGSDYIIQIDGDIVLHKNFIKDHLNNALKKTFVQGCRTILNDSQTRKALNKNINSFKFFSYGIKNRLNALRIPFLSFLIKTDPGCSKNIKACNLAFWREDYVAVNGYDNLFHGWGCEDDEFAARLINYGVKKRRLKLAAICYHLNHRQYPKKNVMNEARYNETILSKRHFSKNGLAQV